MQYAGERWVQRLRDGVPPKRWPFLVGLVVVTLVGAIGLWLTVLHLDDIVRSEARRPWSGPLLSALLFAFGPVAAALSWLRGRRDRRVLARIRAHGTAPAFHLPVLQSALHALDDPPEMWTVDRAGLHAWSPERPDPVFDLVWDDVASIDLASQDVRGQRADVGILVGRVAGSALVLRPRPTIGRPFGASATKLHITMEVLRSLQRELGSHRGTAHPGRTTADR
ncbi:MULTISPECIES: hypothetical protein [unclassified Curtobacterium]|uniref:hypothetical protein n=1 Tax=unclassified Curtobacterium TaxID=257496 RepID=UPI0008DD6360|nr:MULTISPECIES: hypothetical protein [unclassified Curtobacterium]OIH94251.1 hypothetical protein BIU92_07450 [Curtobacterium sp. MCBA15_003]OII29253.1 hypothetical protein BIU94_12550 [Curtobacterium sp. MMLR14_006]